MARKIPQRRPSTRPTSPSVAGEEDPGAALDPGDEAAPGSTGTGEAMCHRCGGSGRFHDAPCPTCGGTGKGFAETKRGSTPSNPVRLL